jgi:hypothetical protein
MRSIRRRLMAVVVATGAVALVAPVSGASAQFPGLPIPATGGFGIGTSAIGGNQIGTAGCLGTTRPSFGGNNGSTSGHTCGALVSFIGPQIGQISSVTGPAITASPFTDVTVSAGPITQVGP